jgi:cytochrome b561
VTVAAVRPDAWNFPLLLHVGGAMVLVGALAAVVVVLAVAMRGETRALRLAFRTLLIGAIPAYIVMRVGAEWIADKQNIADDPPSWIDIGYMVADGGLLLLLIATVLTGLAARRATAGGLVRVANVLTLIVIAGYAVALWAMTTKPT